MALLYILGFFAVGQGLFQIFMLYQARGSQSKDQLLLLLILAFLSLSVFEYSLVWSGDIKWLPHLIGFTTVFQFLFLPLIYGFFSKPLMKGKSKTSMVFHALPFVVVAILLSPHLLQSSIYKLENIYSIYLFTIPVFNIAVPLCIFFVLQAGIYFSLLLKLRSKNLAIYGSILFKVFVAYVFVHIFHSTIIYFAPELIAFLGAGILLVSVLCIYTISYFIYKRQEVIEQESPKKYAHSNMSDLDAQLIIKKLDNLILTDNYFTDADIRMNIVAQKIKVPVQKLSQAINQVKGESFRVYLNSIRIDYAIEHIITKKAEQVSLKEIYYDSGFNNKTSFANAFKKKMSMTPSQFLAKQRLR